MSPSKSAAIPNRILAALPKKDYQSLESHLEEVPLVFEKIIYGPGDLTSDIYFPNSGVISLLASGKDHATLEVGLIGNEGMVGMNVFFGVTSTTNRAVVQGAGSAMKMKAASFRKYIISDGSLTKLLQRYSHSVMTQVTQSAVCNQFHSIDARMARWLLMTHDRMGTDEFQLTQEFLAHMLGVRREGVSKAAGQLQKLNLIAYSRGRLKVLDRHGLEATSCGCYEIIKNESNHTNPRA